MHIGTFDPDFFFWDPGCTSAHWLLGRCTLRLNWCIFNFRDAHYVILFSRTNVLMCKYGGWSVHASCNPCVEAWVRVAPVCHTRLPGYRALGMPGWSGEFIGGSSSTRTQTIIHTHFTLLTISTWVWDSKRLHLLQVFMSPAGGGQVNPFFDGDNYLFLRIL